MNAARCIGGQDKDVVSLEDGFANGLEFKGKK